MSGWAYLSLDAATKDLATKQAQTQSDMQDVASVTSIGSAVAASEVLLNPLPTLAPLARPKVSGVTQNIQPVTQPAVAAPAAAAPAVAAAPAALPKPRKIHVRAVTRASR